MNIRKISKNNVLLSRTSPILRMFNLFLSVLLLVSGLPMLNPVSINNSDVFAEGAEDHVGEVFIEFNKIEGMKFYELVVDDSDKIVYDADDKVVKKDESNELSTNGKNNDKSGAWLIPGTSFAFLAEIDETAYETQGINITSRWGEMDGIPAYSSVSKGYPCKLKPVRTDTEIVVSNFRKRAYNVTLPKKVIGIESLQYERAAQINSGETTEEKWINNGSVSGLGDITIFHGEKLRFVISLKDKGYEEIKKNFIESVKVLAYKSKYNDMTGKWEKAELLKKYKFEEKGESDFASYVSEGIEITGDVIFEIDGIVKDTHEITFTDDDNKLDQLILSDVQFESGGKEYSLTNEEVPTTDDGHSKIDSLKLEKSENGYKMKYLPYVIADDGTKKYTIEEDDSGNVKYQEIRPDYGTYLEFSLGMKEGYTNSNPTIMAYMTGDKEPFQVMKTISGSWKFKVVNDTDLAIDRVEKNQYRISVPSKTGLTYKYMKYPSEYGKDVEEYYEYVGSEDGNYKGSYTGSFSNTGEGTGSYSEENGHYKYVGAGKGAYTATFTYVGDEAGDYNSAIKTLTQESMTADHNDKVLLKVYVDEKEAGLDIKTLEVKGYENITSPNTEPQVDAEGKYKEYIIGEVTNDINLVVSVEKIKYNIDLKVDIDEDEKHINDSYSDVVKFYNIYDNQLTQKEGTTDPKIVAGVDVEHGSNFQFRIDVGYKYSQSAERDLRVYYVTEGENAKEVELFLSNGIYTLQNVKGNKDNNDSWEAGRIEVRNLKLNRYNLSFKNESDKVTFLTGDYTKDENGYYSYAGEANGEYTLTFTSVDVGSKGNYNKVGEHYEYVGENLGDYILVSAVPANSVNNGTVTLQVKYGDTYKFNIKLGYGYSMDGSTVTANGVALRRRDGYYVLENISEDYSVEVMEIGKVKYPVSFQTYDGITFADSDSGSPINSANVEYQGSYGFKINFAVGYEKSKDNIRVYAAPESLKEIDNEESIDAKYRLDRNSSDVYTITNISEGMIVKVFGVEVNKYKVTLPSVEGIDHYEVRYKIDQDTKNKIYVPSDSQEEGINVDEESYEFDVVYGMDFYFKIIAKTGYDISSITMSGADVVTMKDGYVIQGVVQDINLEITNVMLKNYKVTLVGEGITFYASSYSNVPITTGSIEHETGQFAFLISINEGYYVGQDGIKVVVKSASGEELRELTSENNIYTLTQVTQDVTVEVIGAKISEYTVTFPINQEGIEFYELDDEFDEVGKPLENEKVTVTHSSNFKFEIRAKYGYDLSDIIVTAGSNFINGESVGVDAKVYTIEDIKSDITVEVKGVKKQVYKVKVKGDNLTFYDASGNIPLSGNQDVEYKTGSLGFRVAANTGYNIDGGLTFYKLIDEATGEKEEIVLNDKSEDKVNVSGPNDGVYIITNVTERTVIVAEGAQKNIYNITFPEDMLDKVSFVNPYARKDENGMWVEEEWNLQNNAEYLSEFYFRLVPKTGYNIKLANVGVDPYGAAGVKKTSEGYYTIYDIMDNISVVVNGIELNDYDVTLKSEGANFYNENGTQISNFTVKHGQSDTFIIQAKSGYNLLNGYKVVITGNDGRNRAEFSSDDDTRIARLQDGDAKEDGTREYGTTIEDSGSFRYTLSNVQGPITVSIENVGKDEYNVYFPINIVGIQFYDNENNKITHPLTVAHGSSLEFRIIADEGYNINNAIVTANLSVIELKNGKYTIDSIKSDTTVNVEGVVPSQVSVKLKYTDGVIYTDLNDNELSTLDNIKVEYGGTFSFKVSLSDLYNQSANDMKVTADKSSLTYVRGIYTLSNVTEDTVITVSDVKINTYSIDLTEATGSYYLDSFGQVTLVGVQTVKYGETFSFMVGAQEGYNISNLKVKAKSENGNRIELNAVDGVYTITDINENYVIVVENAVKATYRVEMRMTDGVSALDTSGNSLSNQITVTHGSSLSFSLSLGESYNNSVPIVTVKGKTQVIEPVNGLYTVSDIRNDTIIEVTGVTKNTYTITLQKTEGVVYKNSRNKDISGSVEVEWNDTFTFRVSLMDAYDASIPVVMVDDKLTLIENGGFYELPNVTGDRTISVKNVTQNAEESVIGMVITLPKQIVTMNDAQAVIAASRAYEALSEDEKKLVTNLSELHNAQDQAAEILHTSNGVTVGDIDWYIQVIVVPLDSDPNSIQRISEKVDRKSIISLYEITLWDTLKDEKYIPPSDVSLTVVVPAPNLTGYKNEVIVHEKSSGNIEYLDVLINNGYAQFETSSFSAFGIAAKKIPNYVENPSNITISVSSIASDDTVKKLLEDDDIIESIASGSPGLNNGDDSTVGNMNIEDLNKEGAFVKFYNWALDNELIVSIFMILLFSGIIVLIVTKGSKRQNDDNK